MIYFYLGFLSFFLYFFAPLWLFLSVAVASLAVIGFSAVLRKDLARMLGKRPMEGVLALGAWRERGSKVRGVGRERRRFNRVAVTLDVTYEVLAPEERVILPHHPKHPAVDSIQHLKTGSAVARDISEGGLAILGGHSFGVGEQLRISLRFPHGQKPAVLLAEVRGCKALYKNGATSYQSGLRILDMDLEDFSRLMDYLFLQRHG